MFERGFCLSGCRSRVHASCAAKRGSEAHREISIADLPTRVECLVIEFVAIHCCYGVRSDRKRTVCSSTPRSSLVRALTQSGAGFLTPASVPRSSANGRLSLNIHDTRSQSSLSLRLRGGNGEAAESKTASSTSKPFPEVK